MLIRTYFPKITDKEPVIPKTINIIVSWYKSLALNILINLLLPEYPILIIIIITII